MLEPLNQDERWAQIRQRLSQFEQRLAADFAVTGDERDRRLRARSQQWAAQVEEEQAGSVLEVLTFALGGERYAIESEHVAEVLPLTRYTPLPGTPDFVLGIVSVRGHIVSIVDLRVLLELPFGGLADKNFLVVLRGQEMEFGVLVDRVQGSARIRRDAVQDRLANLSGVRAAYLLGVTAEQLTILDGARLLADPRLRVEG